MTCLDTLAREHVEGFTRSGGSSSASHWPDRRQSDERRSPITETLPPVECHEGEGAQESTPASDGRTTGSALPLQRSSGVFVTPPDSLQAKPGQSHLADEQINAECRESETCARATATLACKPCRDAWIALPPEERMRRLAASKN